MRITRRNFIIGGLGVAGALLSGGAFSLLRQGASSSIPGSIVGASSGVGHLLRGASLPEPARSEKYDVVIVGGGIAGLSAAWKLQKQGIRNIALLELESQAGGNSSYGENRVSAYPWGAHYVPLPTEESVHVRELFEELGVITGYDAKRQPIYNEYYLCADPHERLYLYGRWQEGLVPVLGATEEDQRQYKAFFKMMERFKDARGKDGRRAFAIPVDLSSNDKEYRTLDAMTIKAYLEQQGWNSERLHWYVNYCCRDDYGTTYDQVSAWAGIHYFAARGSKAANAESSTVLTWPEGNGWLVKRLQEKISAVIQTGSIAYRVAPTKNGVTVDYYQAARQASARIEAKAAILATPHFVADRLLGRKGDSAHSYAPWMVANITLDALPQGSGEPLCWDNVIYNSESLGYVVATHQDLARAPRETVLTYYWPLSALPPKEARQQALSRSYSDWQAMILKELLRVHPDLKTHITRIDVWLWGHGMIRPTPGYIWGEQRREACRQKPPIFFAHSDMSGISIFEEAQYRGVKAAESVKEYLRA